MITCCKNKRKKSKHGFSLVEIMVAMLILVVLVIGATSMLSQTGMQAGAQGNSRVATELVNKLVEDARAIDFDALASSTRVITQNGLAYTVETTVVESSTPSLRKTVTVSTNYRGMNISATTIVILGTGIQ